MNFPRYWARVTRDGFSGWGWSNNSQVDAEAKAQIQTDKVRAMFRANSFGRQHYGYGDDRPLREPVLREIKDMDGETAAVVTRNGYGCQVLNTAKVLFVDVDLPDSSPTLAGAGALFKRLFGGKSTANAGPDPRQAELVAKADKIAVAKPGWGWRIYRTRAGFRLMAIHGLFDPEKISTDPIFDELGADPLYRRLCKSQKCFRARLTPKPWRCLTQVPPHKWPWTNSTEEKLFIEWERRYSAVAQRFATCELVTTIGASEIHPGVAPIVSYHDETCRVGSNLPLA